MKKIISYCFIAIFALVLIGCGKDEFTITISGEDTVDVGQTITLTASIDPEMADADFVWTSSDDTVATVVDGVVTGVKVGTVEITVTVDNVDPKTKTITVEEGVPTLVEYTPTELQALLEDKLTEYSGSDNGYAKIEANDGEETLTAELIYNLSNDAIDSLMYKLSGDETAHVYVKDGYAYMLREEVKSKSLVTETETANIINNYLFDKFVETISGFYSEAAFFSALSFDSRVENVLTYTLDLTAYAGNVFVTAGKDSITLNVYLSDEEVVKVETLIVEGANTNSTTLFFEGITAQTIEYPTDLDTYLE